MSSSFEARRPAPRRPIRVAVEETFTSLDPRGFSSMTDIVIGRQMYETLVGHDRGLRLEGRLAESWQRSSDGLSYRFTLRPATVFHDGRPVTAAAVSELLARSLLQRIGMREATASVEAVSARELEVRLRRPFAPFLARLADPVAMVVSADSGAGDAHPAGTGAFFRPRVVEGRVHLEEVGAPGSSSAIFVPHRGGVDMLSALLHDRVDLAYECPYEAVRRGVDDPSVVVESCPSLSVNLLLFNLGCRALGDPGARRAVARAIDKRELFVKVNRGVGEVASGPIAPSSPFFRPQPKAPRDPGRDHGTPPAELRVLATAGYTRSWLELFTTQLERGGTRCTVRELPFEELRNAVLGRGFEAVLMGFPGSGDPDPILFEVFHTAGRANYSGMSHPAFDALVDRARLSHSEEERSELYASAIAILDDVVPAVFLRHGASIIARRSCLAGVAPHPLGHIDLARAAFVPTARPGDQQES